MPKKKRRPTDASDDLISSSQAAALINRHVRTIHRLVDEGALKPAGKVPGRTGAYMFHRADVEALAAKDVA